jgi:DNA-binding NarL/FixJ family response regulator
MKKKLKILLLEDMQADAELIEMELNNANMDFENVLVDTKNEFITALNQFTPDVILADHSVASFNSMEALKIVKENGITSPFLVVTTAISEKFAMSVIKEGASDCVLKDNLQRLPDAIKDALDKYSFKEQESLVADAALLKEKLYDLSLLEEMDDNDYIIEIVSIFLNETPKELVEMQTAASSGRIDVVCGKAHKLKSGAGLIQANTLLQILKNIEETAANSPDGSKVMMLVENACSEYKKIEIALQKHLKNIPQ